MRALGSGLTAALIRAVLIALGFAATFALMQEAASPKFAHYTTLR